MSKEHLLKDLPFKTRPVDFPVHLVKQWRWVARGMVVFGLGVIVVETIRERNKGGFVKTFIAYDTQKTIELFHKANSALKRVQKGSAYAEGEFEEEHTENKKQRRRLNFLGVFRDIRSGKQTPEDISPVE